MTNAGVLLVDDSPIRWSRLFCTRWNGLNKSGGTVDALDDAEYTGSVISLIENGEAFIKRNAKKMWKKTPNSRIEMPEYVERSYHELADVFNRLGYMERKGSGFEKIISGYEFQVNYSEEKKPSFRSDRYQFTVIMPNLNFGVEKIDISDVNLWNQIKEAIKENPKVTQRELVGKLGVSFRQIQQNMAEMISAGEISRIGSNRGGYWEVLK